MASPTMKNGVNLPNRSLKARLQQLPFVTRRCAAWAVEVSLVAASALVPYSLGVYATQHSTTELVPLNPILARTEEAIAKTLAIPLPDQSRRQVAPLTNLFWWGALIAPLVVGGWQLYLLGKTGQTLPKRWLGIRVVSADGTPPGLGRVFLREGVGHWGLPVGSAYLIWRYAGAFPDLTLLIGLTGLMLLAESATLWFDPQRRSLHDKIAGTFMLKGSQPLRTQTQGTVRTQPLRRGQPLRLEVESTWTEGEEEGEPSQKRQAKLTTIVLTPESAPRRLPLWYWMRQHPGFTLLLVAFVCMTSILGTFVGTQVYIQSQANRREFNSQKNQVFLALVKQLSATSSNAPEERRGAILALATLEDPRAVPFLIDLLSQETRDELIDTLQQAIVSSGSQALPPLQRLNQSLTNDLKALRGRDNPEELRLVALRQRASQRAIAKILTLYNSQVHTADLSRVDLSSNSTTPAPFTLVLDNTDLSGINFKAAILSHASLQGSGFYSVGEDGRWGTFDDGISDLSRADLKDANLTDALLSYVWMNGTNLIRATLNRANLSNARLTGANLSSAQLINADLRQAFLENASLTGANLAAANFSQSNLQGARLSRISAVETQFTSARLIQSDWQGADLTEANFAQANLRDANLNFTKLVGANLTQAQLQNVSLHNANLTQADLRGANIAGADFQGAIFAASKPLQSDQFIETSSTAADGALVKGVNFAAAKNLDRKQITYICSQGGLHPQCR
jgi:uncharacterized protein YjbI with pentapeptide repeats/uncharacterized RDD family membrane protein YckC